MLTFGLPILFGGSDAQKARYLPAIAEGKIFGTLALTEPSASFEPSGLAYVLWPVTVFCDHGTKLFVANAHTGRYAAGGCAEQRRGADRKVALALLLVPGNAPGLAQTPLQTIAADRQFEIEFRHVEVGAEALLGQLHQGWPLLKQSMDYATVAKCAEMVGMAQVAF